MKKITVYGKGGIGKSMVTANLAVEFALRKMRVLHTGCDPKADSTACVRAAGPKTTVLDALKAHGDRIGRAEIVMPGRHGIECVESGGPAPGLGCGGRGVSRTLEIFRGIGLVDDRRYDLALFDVLGDVVCGGFAAPLRLGFGELVVIVASEEPMALYAANNIARIVHSYAANGIGLAGIVFNLRDNDMDRAPLLRFASSLNTRALAFIPRSRLIRAAEVKKRTVVEFHPESDIAGVFRGLADELLSLSPSRLELPTPVDNELLLDSMEEFTGCEP